MRISPAVDLSINAFYQGNISEYDRGLTNGVIEKRADQLLVTQRPAINIYGNPASQVANPNGFGRGIGYWTGLGTYFVNGASLYKSSYATAIKTDVNEFGPFGFANRCYFLTIEDKLVLLTGNASYIISTDDSVVVIPDGDFPATVVDGGAVLNGRVYVMTIDKEIYNSALLDPSTWAALDFISAEREQDQGVYLAKHHDNLIAFGKKSIEVFYDAGNPVGSPLSRRQDISYNVGGITGDSFWQEGDRIFFLSNNEGSISAQVLENYQLKKLSTPPLDSFLTTTVTEGNRIFGSGFIANGRGFYILTIIDKDAGNTTSTVTLCYDDSTGIWSKWDTDLTGLDDFPLVGFSGREGGGIMYNGYLFTVRDKLVPIDTSSSPVESKPIPLVIRFGQNDFGTSNRKFANKLRVVSDHPATNAIAGISFSDERTGTFTLQGTIDLFYADRSLSRLGSFRRRNTEVRITDEEAVRIEALEVEVVSGVS